MFTNPGIVDISALVNDKFGLSVILPLSFATVNLYPQKVLLFNSVLIVLITSFFIVFSLLFTSVLTILLIASSTSFWVEAIVKMHPFSVNVCTNGSIVFSFNAVIAPDICSEVESVVISLKCGVNALTNVFNLFSTNSLSSSAFCFAASAAALSSSAFSVAASASAALFSAAANASSSPFVSSNNDTNASDTDFTVLPARCITSSPFKFILYLLLLPVLFITSLLLSLSSFISYPKLFSLVLNVLLLLVRILIILSFNKIRVHLS